VLSLKKLNRGELEFLEMGYPNDSADALRVVVAPSGKQPSHGS